MTDRGRPRRRSSPAGMRTAPCPVPTGAPRGRRQRSRSPANPKCCQLRLCRRQHFLGLAEAAETDQGEDVVREWTPRLGKDGRALTDGDARGRDEEGQGLFHVAGTSQAPAQQRVQARTGHPVRLPERLDRAEDSQGAERACVEAEPPSREFVAPGSVELHGEELDDFVAVGRAAQGSSWSKRRSARRTRSTSSARRRPARRAPARPARVARPCVPPPPPGIGPRIPLRFRSRHAPGARRARSPGARGPPWRRRPEDRELPSPLTSCSWARNRVSSWRRPPADSASSRANARSTAGADAGRMTSP